MRKTTTFVAALAALTLVAAACGGDDDDDTGSTSAPTTAEAPATTAGGTETTMAPETTAGGTDTTAGSDTTAAGGGDTSARDYNGDGKVVFGIAAAGPADDGAYYQSVVDAAKELSTENGFDDPIVVDNIQAADAATLMGDLAQQGVDVIIVGASEIAEPLPALIEEYPDIFWYCNCGAGFPENPGLAQSTDSGAEIAYTAGYATGLLLQAKGDDANSTTFIGCCDLGFEKQSYLAYEAGLQAVDPAYTMTYVQTGDFPFDFDNTANATAALQTAVDEGTDAVYPYLGGAHRPVVQAANEAGIITMSAGSSKVCDDSEELHYDIAVKFDGGDYVRAVMAEIIDGTFKEGDTKTFKVGVDPEPGAVICDPTPEQQTAMDEVYAQIGSGELDAMLGEISGTAFSEG
ncbi:MAG: BMP family ABC transporter substrate-binding protein [Actinobacteria bacterium]|nr:BMP family ABC transporter substrate-binding protein [Actinomycetota bacterium]